MRGDRSRTCTCTCNPCTYVFHDLGMFSIMQLGLERGVGVAIAKAASNKTVAPASIGKLFTVIHSSIKDTLSPLICYCRICTSTFYKLPSLF